MITTYFLSFNIDNIMDAISDFEKNDVYYSPEQLKSELTAKT